MRCIGLLAIVLVMGCGDDFDGSLHDPGEVGGHCYPNGTCNVGLDCSAGVCVPGDGGIAGGDAASDALADAALLCSDDSAFEPNDTFATAFPTPVATTKSTLLFTGLAICPAGDRDNYVVTIPTANKNLEVIVDYAPEGTALQASIVNGSGTTIANAAPVVGMPRQVRSYTASLPTGTYYVSVFAQPSGKNNYTLYLNVTGP